MNEETRIEQRDALLTLFAVWLTFEWFALGKNNAPR